ncbi:MAG: anthranilate synthase component I family protein [Ferruginibacter sp.]
MKINFQDFPGEDYNIFKNKMLNWANRFNIFCFLDNNEYRFEQHSFDCILAVGCKRAIELKPGDSFNALKHFYDQKPCWLFGHLGYDLKNEIEKLAPLKKPLIDFGLGLFFEPEIIIQIKNGKFSVICSLQPENEIYEAICIESGEILQSVPSDVFLQNKLSREQYIDTIHRLQKHIRRGDCYEINFCQEYFALNALIDPLFIYSNLAVISANPFFAFYKLNDKYCLCASPERYIKKTDKIVISQPMKGTSRRNLEDSRLDEDNRNYLHNSLKEKSENVMIVDLVRNDLSKICKQGSVIVDELFGLYSFPQVHQMVSTVKGILNDDIDWVGAIKATFPMGSMTGAPKKKVMELIEENEVVSRGLFSGSIGYVNPEGDCDFNVVIRSIFYNKQENILSFMVGSGITFHSDACDEYEECQLKIAPLLAVLKL